MEFLKLNNIIWVSLAFPLVSTFFCFKGTFRTWHSIISFIVILAFLFFLRFYLFNFRERGREGEREGEKDQCVVASPTSPTGNLACNPGMCPHWELNHKPLVHRLALNPLNYTSQGTLAFLGCDSFSKFSYLQWLDKFSGVSVRYSVEGICLGLSETFFMIRKLSAGRPQKWRTSTVTLYQGDVLLTWLTIDVSLDHLPERVLARFLHGKVTTLPSLLQS